MTTTRLMQPILALVLASLATDVSSVAGQVAPSIEPGSRVRITAPSLGLSEAVGTVQEVTDEAVVVQFEFPLRIDRSEIMDMEVSIRRQRRTLKGLGYGVLAGAVSGAMIGLASGDQEGGCYAVCTAGEAAAFLGVAFGLAGGLVGAIIGASVRRDVWSPVLLADVDLTVKPLVREHGTGLHVALALRFH